MSKNKTRGVILIEGPDCSGKTTLANYLIKKYNAYYIHMRLYKDVWKYHLAALRLAAKKAENQLVIIDRHWISECAYAEIYRRGSCYPVGARCLDRLLIKLGATTIMCIRSDRFSQLDLHLERKNKGKEMYDEINKVCDYYENVTNGYKYNCDSLYGNDYCSQYATTHGGLLSRYDVELWDIDNQPNCGMEVWSDRVVEKTKDRYNNHKFVDLRSANAVNFTGRIDNPSTIFVNLINFEEDPGFRSITNPWLSQSITRDSRSIFNNAMNKIRADETRIAYVDVIDDHNKYTFMSHFISLTNRGKAIICVGEKTYEYIRKTYTTNYFPGSFVIESPCNFLSNSRSIEYHHLMNELPIPRMHGE